MRTLPFLLLALLFHPASAQYDKLAYRHNYAFIADSSALVPLQGTYRVEYLAQHRACSRVKVSSNSAFHLQNTPDPFGSCPFFMQGVATPFGSCSCLVQVPE